MKKVKNHINIHKVSALIRFMHVLSVKLPWSSHRLSRNSWEVLPNTAPCSVDLPSWYNVLFGVRIKRRSIQLALLFPILSAYFLLSSTRIWRAQNLDSYLYHFTHILEHSITKNMLHSTYTVYLVQVNISVIITYTVHLVLINNNERYYMHVENIEDSRIHISWHLCNQLRCITPFK